MDLLHQKAKHLCLRWLATREHSQQELRQKLSLKGCSSDAAEAVIAELASEGYQSEQKFAESYARMLINKGYGPLRISQELKSRGIFSQSAPDIAPDLDRLAAENAGGWLALLERHYLKKYSEDRHLPLTEWAKRVRFFRQRGFPVDMLMRLKAKRAIRLLPRKTR